MIKYCLLYHQRKMKLLRIPPNITNFLFNCFLYIRRTGQVSKHWLLSTPTQTEPAVGCSDVAFLVLSGIDLSSLLKILLLIMTTSSTKCIVLWRYFHSPSRRLCLVRNTTPCEMHQHNSLESCASNAHSLRYCEAFHNWHRTCGN